MKIHCNGKDAYQALIQGYKICSPVWRDGIYLSKDNIDEYDHYLTNGYYTSRWTRVNIESVHKWQIIIDDSDPVYKIDTRSTFKYNLLVRLFNNIFRSKIDTSQCNWLYVLDGEVFVSSNCDLPITELTVNDLIPKKWSEFPTGSCISTYYDCFDSPSSNRFWQVITNAYETKKYLICHRVKDNKIVLADNPHVGKWQLNLKVKNK